MKKTYKDLPYSYYYLAINSDGNISNNYLKLHDCVMFRKRTKKKCFDSQRIWLPFR